MDILQNKELRQAIVDPLLSLLRSRRFLLLLLWLIVQLIAMQFPGAAEFINDTGFEFFGVLVAVMILGLSFQDAMSVLGDFMSKRPANTRQTIIELLDEILQERESASGGNQNDPESSGL